jgi:DUF971 family protein
MNPPTPVDIVDHQGSGVLEIGWADGATSRLPHRLLRMQCRCAACEQQRRHGAGPPDAGAELRLVRIDAVGGHGLNLAFSDGHDRGIYPWALLRQLGALSPTQRPVSPCPTPASNAC